MKKLILFIIICLFNTTLAEEISYHSTPLQAVFEDRPIVEYEELSNFMITQTLPQLENPNEVIIEVTESELLDDSMSAIKSIYSLQKSAQGWMITSKIQTQKCRRGKQTQEFTDQLCP